MTRRQDYLFFFLRILKKSSFLSKYLRYYKCNYPLAWVALKYWLIKDSTNNVNQEVFDVKGVVKCILRHADEKVFVSDSIERIYIIIKDGEYDEACH